MKSEIDLLKHYLKNNVYFQIMLEKHGNLFDEIIEKYSESFRKYHNLEHINNLLLRAERFRPYEDYTLQIAIVYHDVVYKTDNVRPNQNEHDSAHLFASHYAKMFSDPAEISVFISGQYKQLKRWTDKVYLQIMNTANEIESLNCTDLRFLDRYDLQHGDFETLLLNDFKIREEFTCGQAPAPPNFREKRKLFLLKAAAEYNNPHLLKIANSEYYNV